MRKLAAALMVFSTISLSGCATAPMDHGQHQNQTSSSSFTDSEIMFAQMMIPHHRQAVTMANFVAAKTNNQAILELASGIKVAQEPEISQLIDWLEKSGAGQVTGDHSMHMDGMLSDAELVELNAATGTEFEKLFLEGMIKHHEGAIDMLSMIADSTNPEVQAFANAVRDTQGAEIKTMQNLLKNY